ncbi:hypothetical protein ACFVXQ_03690 [Kitasatospora sp. NPDC058263]
MPYVPQDVSDLLRDLDRRMRAIEGRANIRPAQNQILAGDVTVGQGGQFRVDDADGDPMFYVGAIDPANPDGTGQRGLLVFRQDGTLALSVSQVTTAPGYPQAVVIRDSRGNTLFAEDVGLGGLAAPIFGASGWYGYSEVPQWTTGSGSWSTCMSLPWRKCHPRVQAHYLARCSDGSTSGEIRILDGSGSVVAQQALGAGSYVVGSLTGPVSGAHLGTQTLTWQARVTGGSGTVGVRGLSTFGVAS